MDFKELAGPQKVLAVSKAVTTFRILRQPSKEDMIRALLPKRLKPSIIDCAVLGKSASTSPNGYSMVVRHVAAERMFCFSRNGQYSCTHDHSFSLSDRFSNRTKVQIDKAISKWSNRRVETMVVTLQDDSLRCVTVFAYKERLEFCLPALDESSSWISTGVLSKPTDKCDKGFISALLECNSRDGEFYCSRSPWEVYQVRDCLRFPYAPCVKVTYEFIESLKPGDTVGLN